MCQTEKKSSVFSVFYGLLALLISVSSCEKDTVIVERTVKAVWSADDSEILKVVSLYETDDPGEKYYNATSGENWEYRFEICQPDLSGCVTVGQSGDINMGGLLQYQPLYWLPGIQKILTRDHLNKAVLKNLQGDDLVLEIPPAISNALFEATGGYYDASDLSPSPEEEVAAVFFMASYLGGENYTDITHIQCLSFFELESGNHMASYRLGFDKVYPQLQVSYPDFTRRWNFLWSNSRSGVYIVTRYQAYFVGYGSDSGIEEVDYVPERPVNTNSGQISNSGKLLRIEVDGNNTFLDISQLEDWIPFDSLGLIPKESNTYSLY